MGGGISVVFRLVKHPGTNWHVWGHSPSCGAYPVVMFAVCLLSCFVLAGDCSPVHMQKTDVMLRDALFVAAARRYRILQRCIPICVVLRRVNCTNARDFQDVQSTLPPQVGHGAGLGAVTNHRCFATTAQLTLILAQYAAANPI